MAGFHALHVPKIPLAEHLAGVAPIMEARVDSWKSSVNNVVAAALMQSTALSITVDKHAKRVADWASSMQNTRVVIDQHWTNATTVAQPPEKAWTSMSKVQFHLIFARLLTD